MEATYKYRSQCKAPNCIFDQVCDLLNDKVKVYVEDESSQYYFPADKVESIFAECSACDVDAAGEPSGPVPIQRRGTIASLTEFRPSEDIEHIKLADILKCNTNCEQCQYFPINHARIDTLVKGIISAGETRSVRLVALLCWIGTPHLIGPLYNKDVHDKDLEPSSKKLIKQLKSLMNEDHAPDYFPAAKRTPYKSSAPKTAADKAQDLNNFAAAYRASILQFSLREFPGSWNLKFIGPGEVLPITEREYVGEGSFGKVDGFQIYPFYDKNYNGAALQKPKRYARKRVPKKARSERVLNNAESIASEQFQTLQSENIIRYHCAYEDSDNVYLIFDYVEHTLQKFFDDSSLLPQPLHLYGTESSILETKLWNGIEGVIRALDALHNKDGKRIGIHRDLKPINILVDEKGTFFICDFGLSYFSTRVENPFYYTSGNAPTNTAQDGMYAPPPSSIQIGRPPRTQGTQYTKDDPVYDMWSLACVIIELLVFIVGFKTSTGAILTGSEGIKKFREARCEEAKNQKGRFWVESASEAGSRFQVSPAVERAMSDILARKDEDVYLKRMLLIIVEMFKVDASKRLLSSALVEKIDEIKGEMLREKNTTITVAGRNPLDVWVDWYREDHEGIKLDCFFSQKSDKSSAFTIYNVPNLCYLETSTNKPENNLRTKILPRQIRQLQFRNDHYPRRSRDRILYLSLSTYKDEKKNVAQTVPDHEFSYRKEERVYPLHLYNPLFENIFSFKEIRPSYRFQIHDRKAFYKLLYHRLIGVRLLSDQYGSLSQLRFKDVQIYRSPGRKKHLEAKPVRPGLRDPAPVTVHIWLHPEAGTEKSVNTNNNNNNIAQSTEMLRTSSQFSGSSGQSTRSEVNIASIFPVNSTLKKAPKHRLVIFRPTVPDCITIPFETLGLNVSPDKKCGYNLVVTPGNAKHGGLLSDINCFRFLPREGEEFPSIPTDLEVLTEEEQKMQNSRLSTHIEAKSIVISFEDEDLQEVPEMKDRNRFAIALRRTLGFPDDRSFIESLLR